MEQWIHIHWNSSFVNQTQLPLLCEKTGAVALAQPVLMADEMLLNFKDLYLNLY